jgi:hypothetical protein
MAKADLTPARLRELLDYDATTGAFTRKTAGGGMPAGAVAGGVDKINGYNRIRVEGSHYRAHRLVWMFMTGQWPTSDIDHINQNKADNRWANLRVASKKQNNQNRSAANTGTRSGFRGVDWCRSRREDPWRATISNDGKKIHIGYFPSAEDAYAAYLSVKSKIHDYSPSLTAERTES